MAQTEAQLPSSETISIGDSPILWIGQLPNQAISCKLRLIKAHLFYTCFFPGILMKHALGGTFGK